jgi:hypothetical protein
MEVTQAPQCLLNITGNSSDFCTTALPSQAMMTILSTVFSTLAFRFGHRACSELELVSP